MQARQREREKKERRRERACARERKRETVLLVLGSRIRRSREEALRDRSSFRSFISARSLPANSESLLPSRLQSRDRSLQIWRWRFPALRCLSCAALVSFPFHSFRRDLSRFFTWLAPFRSIPSPSSPPLFPHLVPFLFLPLPPPSQASPTCSFSNPVFLMFRNFLLPLIPSRFCSTRPWRSS